MFQIVFSFIFIFCFIWKFAKTKQKSTSSHTWVSFLPTRPSVTHRSFLFPKLHESTPVAPSVGGCKPVDAAPIDGILPSLSAAQQMAGGLGSPDIHHCLAVRCSRSSALTSRPVPRTSLPPPLRGPPSNDATKWGAFSPGAFFFFSSNVGTRSSADAGVFSRCHWNSDYPRVQAPPELPWSPLCNDTLCLQPALGLSFIGKQKCYHCGSLKE